MKNLVFDIETIPDLDFGRKYLNLDGLSDEDVGKSMFFQQHQRNGSEFLPYDLHQIIAVSILIDDSENLSIQSYNVDGSYNEKSILIDLFKLFEESDALISWNGKMFDLPVLNCRSLKNLTRNSLLKYPNIDFLKHIDLKDILSNHNIRNISSLDTIAKGLNLPGKKLSSGSEVWGLYLDGNINEITDYCTIDVLNTYLVYTHFEFITGIISEKDFDKKNTTLKQYLKSLDNEALNNFAMEMNSSN